MWLRYCIDKYDDFFYNFVKWKKIWFKSTFIYIGY